MPEDPGRVDLATPDLAAEKRAAFDEIFPGVIADGVLDASRLSELLDVAVTAPAGGRERYGLMWAGKHESVRSLLTPSRGALIPDLERSVDFDTAQNVFIEGDNLEVLKLIQKAYNDRIKLIYIDPPYNTGKDFVYNDNFADGLRGYLEYTGQLDDQGNRATTSLDTAGRRHSRWLSMMFPRLVLARNLLSQDGVVFVSIDDNEVHNLRVLMDEVFGQENFLGCITVVSNLKGRSDDKHFATAHNYLLAYQRSLFIPRGITLPAEYLDDYPEIDEQGNRYRLQGLRKRGSNAKRSDRPSMYYPFFVDPMTRNVALSPDNSHTIEVLPRLSDGSDGRWRWGRSTAENRLSELMGREVGKDGRWDIFQIDFLEREGEQRRATPKTVWEGSAFSNETGTLEVKKLLGSGVFDNPKPIGLLSQIIDYSMGPNDVVLDFFAGSGTTADAVLQMNARDGGRRQCVSINLPEPVPADSPAEAAGFRTVADITYARIRAAMEALTSKAQGLRVFKLSSSQFRRSLSEGQSELFDLSESTLLTGHPDLEALAAQVLLAEGIPLDAPWERHRTGDTLTVLADGVAVVLSTGIDDSLVTDTIALRPRVVVFLEDGFAGRDTIKANAFTQTRDLGITMKTV